MTFARERFNAPFENWTSFTPTLEATTTNPTIGNGSLTGKYKRLGTSVTVKISFKFGSTSNAGSGSWQFRSLPYPATGVGETTLEHVGASWVRDAGTAFHVGAVRTLGADDVRVYTDAGEVAHNVPMTWAINDQIHLQVTYETDFS